MANPYINIYKNNPTVGGTDGTAVSDDGSFTAPVSVTLDASQNQQEIVKLAVRCEDGYCTDGNTTIEVINDTANHWSLCGTQNGTFSSSITISSTISSVNVIFYAKAVSSSSESPGIYNTPKFQTTTKIIVET